MRLAGMIIILLSISTIAYAKDTTNINHSLNKNLLIARNAPPGLQKKGYITIPSFLGKTPPGWDEGLKKGWDKNPDWRWDKRTRLWENKHWQWDSESNHWRKGKRWK